MENINTHRIADKGWRDVVISTKRLNVEEGLRYEVIRRAEMK